MMVANTEQAVSRSSKISLVIDRGIHHRLKQFAKAHKRSVGQQAEYLIQRYLDTHDPRPGDQPDTEPPGNSSSSHCGDWPTSQSPH